MFVNDWKKDIFTIPNMLSMFRLLLIPVYIIIYLNAHAPRDFFLAGSILAVSCLTDMIDGQIARRFNMISNFGKFLDPLADKMTQLTLTVCLSIRYPMLRLVLLLFLAKEFFQAITALILYRRGKALPGAIMPGKICTTVLFVSFILLVLIPDLNPKIANIIGLLDAFFLSYAFISYIFAFFGKHSKVQDLDL